EDDGVAHVRGHGIRSKDFQRQKRVLDAPDGIAGIQAGPDKLLPGLLDHGAGLPGLHIARVVLDRDLHAQIHRLIADAPEELDGRLHVRFDRRRAEPVLARPHVAAHGGRAYRLRDPQAFQELLARRAGALFPAPAGLADAPHAAIDRDTELLRPILDA